MGMKPRKKQEPDVIEKPESASPEAKARRYKTGAERAANQKRITSKIIENWSNKIGAIAPSTRVEVYDPKYGKVGQFDFLPDLKDIKKEFGVGVFRLVVKRPDDNHRMVYAACRTVIIE